MQPPRLPRDWGVVEPTLLEDGVGGKVWRVSLTDGRIAALKQASAAARHESDAAAAFLRWRDGHGAVRLICDDGELSLYEWAGETSLHAFALEHGDDDACEIAADVVARLHAPSPVTPPARLKPLRAHFSSLFDAAGATVPAGYGQHLRATAALAESLLASQRDAKPLHGDIHHDNILLGARGWLAIDAKGLIGDPAYDAANLFQNPVGHACRQDPARIANLARAMATATGREIAAVLEYALAYSGLSIAWWLEDGNDEAAASTLGIGRAIAGVLGQIRT